MCLPGETDRSLESHPPVLTVLVLDLMLCGKKEAPIILAFHTHWQTKALPKRRTMLDKPMGLDQGQDYSKASEAASEFTPGDQAVLQQQI